jgi:hypothetical protein
MADYTSGKIYCLWCNDEYYYIGSTKNELRYRLGKHKQDSKRHPERKVYEHINEIGWDNVKIQLIEEFPCNNRKELCNKENEYIASMRGDVHCLNIKLAELTPEELLEQQKNYRQENRDKILDYKKKYRDENKIKIEEYNKKYKEINKDEIKEKLQEYNQKNKEKIALQTKAYREAHKEEIKEWRKKYKEENTDKIKEKSKISREKNKDKIKERGLKYYEENREAINQKNKEYQLANKERLKLQQKKYREEMKLKKPQVSQECSVCKGTFTEHHKPRHDSSKKHLEALALL